MTSPPSVSVVIPARNAGATIARQLHALDTQAYEPGFEIVVADNASADGTRRAVASTELRHTVRVVDAGQHPGAAWARNVGARAATGELLLFCDADDVVDAHWVCELVSAACAHPGALLAGNVLHDRLNPHEVARAYSTLTDDEIRLRAEAAPRFAPATAPFAGFLPTAPGNSFGITREQYLSLGGMRLTFGAEDTDLAWRAQLHQIPLVSVPRAFVHYQLKHSVKSIMNQQRIQQRERIHLWTLYREHGMTGPSFRHSLAQLVRQGPRVALPTSSREERLSAAWLLGAHVGALEGIVRYRVLPGHGADL